jgi:hypothetical protein
MLFKRLFHKNLLEVNLHEKRPGPIKLSKNVERKPLGKVKTQTTRMLRCMALLESRAEIVASIKSH